MRCFTAFAGAVVAAAGVIAPHANAADIALAADTWCPYNCEPGAEKPGYVVELAKEIYSAAGHTVHYERMPWNRALEQTAAGKVDGAIAVSTEPQTDKMVLPEGPLGKLEISMVTNADSDWTYSGRESLEGKKLGVHADYGYPKAVESYMKANEDMVYPASGSGALTTNLKLVARGRIDVFPVDKSVANYLASQAGLSSDIRIAGQVSESLPLYVGFSKKVDGAKSYAETWTQGVQKLRESGELQKILQSYSVADWANK